MGTRTHWMTDTPRNCVRICGILRRISQMITNLRGGQHRDIQIHLPCSKRQWHPARLRHPYPLQHLQSMCHRPGRFSAPLHEHSHTRRKHTAVLCVLLSLSINSTVIFVILYLHVSSYFYSFACGTVSLCSSTWLPTQVPPVSASCMLRWQVGVIMPRLIWFDFFFYQYVLKTCPYFHIHLAYSLELVTSDIFYCM